jgi:ArsR family transcriptional regulator
MHEQTIVILKALSDPTRLDIVRRLAKKVHSESCSQVSSCSSLSQPAMSHHLCKLVEAGVVLEQKNGKEKFYLLNTKLLLQNGINASKL